MTSTSNIKASNIDLNIGVNLKNEDKLKDNLKHEDHKREHNLKNYDDLISYFHYFIFISYINYRYFHTCIKSYFVSYDVK